MVPLSNLVFENAISSAESLTDGTKKSYLKQLRMALKYLGDTYHFILSHPWVMKKKLEDLVEDDKLSFNSCRSLVTVLISLFKHAKNAGKLVMSEEVRSLHAEWTELLDEYETKAASKAELNEFTERELEGFVEVDEWLEAEKKLRNTELGSLKHLIVAFHTLITPLRGGDLAVVKIIKPEQFPKSEGNVLVFQGVDKPSTLYIRDHKTRSSFAVLERKLPIALRKAIAQSLKDKPRNYLFVDSHEGVWDRNSFLTWKSNTFNNVFNKPVTTNLARHAFVNATRSSTDSIADERKRANDMGHSLDMHHKYRRIQK
jgi:hypothetical protein